MKPVFDFKKIKLFWVCLLSAVCLFGQDFTDVSLETGFDHSMNARSLMGGGVAFFDLDQDGDDDFYITGGLDKDRIYRNEGDGSFSLILDDIGLNITAQYNTTGVTTGDVDNDGDRDVFVTTWERYENGNEVIARNLIFENNGNGTFLEVGMEAGITQQAFGIGANFLDYNKDGLLDIYVINHVESPAFLYDDYGVIVGFDHDCYPNFFYQNKGGFTFEEVGAMIGTNSGGCGLAAIPSDYDQDGDIDIMIANDFGPFLTPNELLQNNYPSENFSATGSATGADIPMYGMGIAASDYDHDLDLDYYITNLGANVLLENIDNQFSDVASAAGVENTFANGSNFSTGWGTAFFDINNDSWEDLFVANGRIPSLSTLPTAMQDPNKLFMNMGDGTFSDISASAQVDLEAYNRGMAYADYDQDGDLDFLVVSLNELGGKSKIYRNDVQTDNHFIQFKLVGTDSNRDAYGSKVWIYTNGQAYLKELYGGGASHLSQHTSVLHFGLGDAAGIDSIKIEWTNGLVEKFGARAADQLYIIEEGFTSGVVEKTLNVINSFEVFPNPVVHDLYLRNYSESIVPLQYNLFALNGDLIESKVLSHENRIELPAGISAGMYLLEIETAKGNQMLKFIKN